MMNNSSPPAVSVRGLTVVRGRNQVFSDLDLDVASHKITGLMGPSGCGKTTLLRSIVGVQITASGSVTVLNEPAGSPALRQRVAYGTQGAAVYSDLTVRQNLSYFASLLGAGKDDVVRAIQAVGLDGQTTQTAGSLSGGQETRVSLAIALLGSPALVVLDEPTVGLDPVLRAELWSIFRSIADAGATVIVSSHVMDEALRCDNLILMRQGRVVADTTPAGLLADTGERDPDAAFLELIRRDAEASLR